MARGSGEDQYTLTQVVAKGLGTVAVVQAQHVANHVKHH
jgi:hypothetical protein